MPFNDYTTPLKPKEPGKYQVVKVNGKLTLSEEQKAIFCKVYPRMFNQDIMRMFGLSFSTMQRFAHELGLVKNMDVIRHKQAMLTKRICEKNGYYDSMRGKQLSPQCRQAIIDKFASGWHPLKAIKSKSTKKYNNIRRGRSERRKALFATERRRLERGLDLKTNLHIPMFNFTKSQLNHRYHALNRGYLLGSKSETSGQRYTIFYDAETKRNALFEKNCMKDGFTIKEYIAPKQHKYVHKFN